MSSPSNDSEKPAVRRRVIHVDAPHGDTPPAPSAPGAEGSTSTPPARPAGRAWIVTATLAVAAIAAYMLARHNGDAHGLAAGTQAPDAGTPSSYNPGPAVPRTSASTGDKPAPSGEFISQDRCTKQRETSRSRIEGLRRRTDNSDALVRALMAAEAPFTQAETDFAKQDWERAHAGYTDALRRADAFDAIAKAREDAHRLYAEFTATFDPMSSWLTRESAETSAALGRLARDGDAALRKEQYPEAAAALAKALVEAKPWADRFKVHAANLAAEAEAAIARGDQVTAVARLEQLAALLPEDAAIRARLESARHLAEVHPLLQLGSEAEAKGAWAEARTRYAAALAIDPSHSGARDGLARTEIRLEEIAFAQVTQAIADLEAKSEFDAALDVIAKAHTAHPTRAQALQDAEGANRAKAKAAKISALLTKAYDLERAHDYAGASTIYKEILAIDPANKDAQEGQTYSNRVLAAESKYNTLLRYAQEDYDKGNFVSARRNLDQAIASKPSTLAVSPVQERLLTALKDQDKPVEVTLSSNNRTHVRIVGREFLGAFGTKELSMMPGDYTLIGVRTGYHDETVVIKVRAGEKSPTFKIACTREKN